MNLKHTVPIFSIVLLAGSFDLRAENITGQNLADAALERTTQNVVYDGSYHSISYPGGDVPANIGVCTDVVIRSYRALGIDLQKLVHEDMRANFASYPKIWGLKSTDRNIDHRRVPNLRVFFTRYGQSLPLSRDVADYLPGDLVTWNLNKSGSLPHIGIVSDRKSSNSVPLIVHNIGFGPQIEDMLFDYKMTGHYRYIER
ncbi:hypothetical protein WH96_16795 [Kiloniella spongiae]|uniref:DUF1287 domain-containing protein n=1 Tax=Kiloniella spongiae TaxID=1489064 RepID=A0A0H2MAJ7_9PROT|nr:DUF1287 domain-containing protein [Kiloniella spongiae]KLN59534.1 hypothetical protein WH96_16795 [Kiloniella spongiae]